MTGTLWFLLGQLAGVALQAGRWVNDQRGWLDYFKTRSHQGRHVVDAIFSIMFFVAWQQNMLLGFASLFGVEAWIKKLPIAPAGLGCFVIGGGLCIFSRWFGRKYLDVVDPPDPPSGG